jgi:hypothetical protein
MEDRYIAILIVAGMVIYFWVVSEIELNKSSREWDEYANRKNKEALENKIKKLDRKLDRLQNKTNASKVKIKPKVQKPPSKTILRNRLVNSVRKQLKGFENNDLLLDEWSLGYVFEISNTIARRIYKLNATKDRDKYTSSIISYVSLIFKTDISEAIDIFEEMSDLNGNSTVFDKGMQVASYDAGSYIDINTEFIGWFNYLNGK